VNSINCVKKKIEGIIEKSLIPEDLIHSKNTMNWLLKLKPDADNALKIAALAHDIERAVENRKVKRKDYNNYDEFKKVHALNSAEILKKIMEDCKLKKELVKDVFFLVSHHEKGGDERIDVLMYADTISFFQVNIPYYFIRNSVKNTKKRYLWGYRKLPDNLKRVVTNFHYQDKKLEALTKTWVNVNN